jgi:hypothetical protein
MLDLSTLIADDVEFAAEWRELKADEYPHDARRNLEAAARLTRIAADLKELEGSEMHWRLANACARDHTRFSETLLELTRAVGFRSSAKTGAEFVIELLFLLQRWDDEPGELIQLPAR